MGSAPGKQHQEPATSPPFSTGNPRTKCPGSSLLFLPAFGGGDIKGGIPSTDIGLFKGKENHLFS